MARRTSSRAASHDQASSPPKPDASRRTVRSPQKRSTRATRSQSRDLDEPYAPALRQGGGRNERQGSVDSVGSDASAANNGRGKKVRGNAPIQPELSMVAEDEEMQGSLENEEAQQFPNLRQPPEPMPGPSKLLQPAPAAKKSLLPAAPIHSTSQRNSVSKAGIRNLFNYIPPTNAAPPSNQQQLQHQVTAGPSAPKTPQNNVTRQLHSTSPAKISQEEQPDNRSIQDGDELPRPHFTEEEMIILFMKNEAEKNKENRPLPTEAIPQASATTLPANPQRKSFIERQPSAHRVSQISDSDVDSQPEPAVKQLDKRAREESEALSENERAAGVDEDEVSEDDGFERDIAQLPDRMRNPPPEVIQITGGSRKRARNSSRIVSHGPAGDAPSRQPRINATVPRLQQQQSSDRAQSRYDVVSPIEEELNDGMRAYREVQRQASQVREAQLQVSQLQASQFQAAQEMLKAQALTRRPNTFAQRPTQTRTKWTHAEEDRLVDMIAQFGHSWADLLTRGHDEGIFIGRDQVGLKDKARNMKVVFLSSGSPLPANFDFVALGKKERDIVIKRGFNPWRKEGEIVGQESLDMDGNPKGVFD